jgi:HlyD family secretion protein
VENWMSKRWIVAMSALALACGGSAKPLRIAGTVEIREVRVSSLSAGRLLRLLRDEGDTVRAGDTIAILVQPGLDALIAQRRAQARAAGSRVAEIIAARADSERAANDFARAERLRAQNIISAQQYDGSRAAAAAAAARLQSVQAASTESDAAIAALAVTQSVADQLTLIAPADGIVLVRYAEPGEAVAVGAPVVSLGLVKQPWIRAYVGERQIARVALGQTVRVHVDGYPDTTFTGRISEIAPRAEFTPRAALTESERADLVFAIKVAIDDAGGRLKAGMPVDLEIALLP